MRFEMKADDVMTLIGMIYVTIDSNEIELYRIEKLVNKIKVYGQSAFINRESYRNTVSEMKETISKKKSELNANK